MNDKYYFENSVSVCIKKDAIKILEKEAIDKKCKVCGGSLFIITMMEGTYILCKKHPWSHYSGYQFDMSSNFEKMPKIIKGVI